ncbi:hypothetical protein TWF281_007687 [Arthrobotrys megalospora]
MHGLRGVGTGVTIGGVHIPYGQDPTSPYGHPPVSSQYGHPVVPVGIRRSRTMDTDEMYSKAVVRYGEHPDPAPSDSFAGPRRRRSGFEAPSPEPRRTTVTDVVDETDIPARYPSDSESSNGSRRQSRGRRRLPLRITAPPIPGDRERRPYATHVRDESENPPEDEYRETEPEASAAPTDDIATSESGTEEGSQSEPSNEPEKPHYQRPGERRVAFAGESSDAASSHPQVVPVVDTSRRPTSTMSAGRHHRPTTRSSMRREEPKPQDQDSIFYYLPDERPAEKSKGKETPEEKKTVPELPKVLPVFQWPTNASVEAALIEKKRLSRKRASSRGSRSSNPPKKTTTAEAEASDESYSMLKNILDDLHKKLETSKSKRARAAYRSCGSSDYIEVEKSLKEIETTHLALEDSPQKTKTLKLIDSQKKIVDVSRKIISFFIPQNWKDGKLVERFWYIILQLVTIGFYEQPQVERLFTRTFTKLESINRHIQVIITGVAGDDKDNPRYRIPSALVEAFQTVVEAMVLVLVRVEYLKEFLALGPDKKPEKPVTVTQVTVDKKFDTCKSKLREGKFQLMCMIYTGRTKDQTNYEEACTETIVSFIIRNLICLPITAVEGASGPLNIYHERLMNLDIEAKYRPQQRIIQDITYLGEEVNAFDQVRKAQSRVLWATDTLLHPKGSLDIEGPRLRHEVTYSHPRNRMGGGMGQFLKEEQDGIDDYARRSTTLHNSVVEALSLKEEDNGKAIMVFTIVTTVFLPLNFMTSFFGMNTTDIRDTDRDQRIFWATAVPVTVVVVGFALSWAYIGDSIQDRLFGPYSFWGKLFKGRLSRGRGKAVNKAALYDDEDEYEEDGYEVAPDIDDYPKPAPAYEARRATPSFARSSASHSHFERARHSGPFPIVNEDEDEDDEDDDVRLKSDRWSHHHHHHHHQSPPGYYDRDRDRDRERERERDRRRSRSRSHSYGGEYFGGHPGSAFVPNTTRASEVNRDSGFARRRAAADEERERAIAAEREMIRQRAMAVDRERAMAEERERERERGRAPPRDSWQYY